MNRIFISYRWGDRKSDEDFHEVVNVIEKSTGLTSFWDTRELRSGNFIDALQEGVRTADIFMPVVTKSYISFGKEGGRSEDKDFCLLEYAAAVVAGKKIVPFFFGVEGNTITVSYEDAKAAAERVLNLSYSTDDVTVLQKYLRSQNGVTISNVDEEQIRKSTDRLCSIVFDTFCTTDSNITFYKKHLDTLAARLDPIRIFGDFDDSGLTLGNSYVPLSFLRHLTEKERKENENRRESTAPTEASEEDLLSGLKSERLAVIVGDAGQGKSSFVRHITIQLAQQAQRNGLSRELFFPLYLECKSIYKDSMSSCNSFRNELAEKSGLSRPALDAVMRFGKPLFIFDAMDEIPPDHMDALIDAIYKHIYTQNNKPSYFLFTSRPGQRLVSGRADFSLGNDNKSVVRKYSVKEFDDNQQELYIDNHAKVKKADSDIKNTFLQALRNKENVISDYRSISRNPFMLFAIFSTYTNSQDLPENRFDAISRVIDDNIERDLKKQDYRPINKKNIKEILGAVSCLFYHRRDIGKTPHASMQTPYDLAEKIYHLDDSDRDDRKLLNKYSEFFGKSNLLDENGFRHDFLASTYAAYYLLFLMKSKVKKEKSPLEVNDISSLKKDTDYWKGVTEALLCLIDRESEDSKTYIEPLIDELQNIETPDYDTLCSAVSQFVNHQPRTAILLLSGMLDRGCNGIIYGEQTDSGFICRKGVNPYEELFYYPAIYPFLQQYLPKLTTGAKEDEEKYLCSELIKEVCAVLSEKSKSELQKVYAGRVDSIYSKINKNMENSSFRVRNDTHGYVRIKHGTKQIGYKTIDEYFNSDDLHNQFLLYLWKEFGDIRSNELSFDHCEYLTSISIPNSIKTIGREAFEGCIRLEKIIIFDSLTSSGDNSLKEIGDRAFWGCSRLKGFFIPESLQSIGDGAFYKCTSLANITVEKDNKFYTSVDGVVLNKDKTAVVIYPAGKPGEYVIPESVNTINRGAFGGCINLTSIIIHADVTSIDYQAFFNCRNLQKIIVDRKNKIYSSKDGVLFNKNITKLINYPAGIKGPYTIPNCVTSIENTAFSDCIGLTDIIIPNGITKINKYTFGWCSELTTINIPPSVTEIDDGSFVNCTNLTGISLSENIISIGKSAFEGCKKLRNINIPTKVRFIGNSSFRFCTELKSIIIPESITSIGRMAFDNCSNLISIEFHARVKTIRYGTFRKCSNLKSIIIPDSVTSIDTGSFVGCPNLRSISISPNTKFIGPLAFANCQNLTIHGKKGSYAEEYAEKNNIPFVAE